VELDDMPRGGPVRIHEIAVHEHVHLRKRERRFPNQIEKG
jgi:hypothetical protein